MALLTTRRNSYKQGKPSEAVIASEAMTPREMTFLNRIP